MIAKRMVDLMPKLANVKVRRTWRGLYPMTPDGFPIVGAAHELEGYVYAVGMCGQGYMLGPGVGVLVSHLVQDSLSPEEDEVLEDLNPYREFGGEEKLK
jgi:sarcosine oxidase subunit beta